MMRPYRLLTICLLSLSFCVTCGHNEMGHVRGDTMTVSGSASALPTVRLLAEAYQKENPRDRIRFLPAVHSGGGAQGAAAGTFDMGVISRELTAEEEKHRLCTYPFARDLLVFATHPDVGVQDISMTEVLQIYSGKFTNWKELGGSDLAIVVLDRPKHTSAKLALEETIFVTPFQVTGAAIILERPDQMVESLLSIPGSIGYTSFSDLFIRNIKLGILHVNGITPRAEALEQEDERQTFRTYAFVMKDRPSGLARRFIDFVYSARGETIIRSKGLAPGHREIVAAFVPAVNIMEQETRYLPLFHYLSHKMGVHVRVKYAASYAEVVEDFASKKIDAAFLGSFAYALVNARTPLSVVGRPIIHGQSQYTGILFVRKDSGISHFEELRNKTFCFVDRATTAGFIFPLIYLKDHGVNRPEDFFGKIFFSGSHDASVLSVLNGDAHAGVAKDLVLIEAGKKDPRIALDLVMIASSPPVPTNGLCVRQHLDWDLKEDLQKVLLGLDRDSDAGDILKRLGATRFIPTTDEDYKNLYDMVHALNIDLKTFDLGESRDA
ncbi:MAG: phosphate/phosphite/phosphonate ABC transporter substrate-binding protein, partial [bacterium]|nr:phosphate/phosphite/phosphonate ABC transporter substrate-binding protein [bacterium]